MRLQLFDINSIDRRTIRRADKIRQFIAERTQPNSMCNTWNLAKKIYCNSYHGFFPAIAWKIGCVFTPNLMSFIAFGQWMFAARFCKF